MKNKTKLVKKIKPALLIIDVQNIYLRMIQERDKELAFFFINLLIDLFRKNDYPIIRIYHFDKDDGPGPDDDQFQYPAQVLIRSEDTRIIKTYSDSFNKTNLDEVLKKKGINTVFLCGLSAVGCVMASLTGARNNDYNAFIVRDAIMSHNTTYTRNIETMFDAISFDAIKLIVESSDSL